MRLEKECCSYFYDKRKKGEVSRLEQKKRRDNDMKIFSWSVVVIDNLRHVLPSIERKGIFFKM